jgi:hypothetical protein
MLQVTAVAAPKHLSLAGQWFNASTSRAGLRAVGRINFRQLTSLPGELVPEELSQEAPSLIEDAAGESSVGPDHIADLEILDHDGAVALGVVVTELVTKGLPLPPNLAVKICNANLRFLSVVRSFLSSRDGTLDASKSLEGFAVKTRGFDEHAVRIGDNVRDTSINGDDGLGLGARINHLDFAGDAHEPLIAVSLERAGLGLSFEGPMDNGSEVTELRETDRRTVQPPSFRVWFCQAEVITAFPLEARGTGHPFEAALPRLVEFDEELSTNVAGNICEPRKLGTEVREFVDLVERTGEAAFIPWTGIAHSPLLKSQIPQPAKSTFPLTESLDLSLAWVDAVTERLAHQHSRNYAVGLRCRQAARPRASRRTARRIVAVSVTRSFQLCWSPPPTGERFLPGLKAEVFPLGSDES